MLVLRKVQIKSQREMMPENCHKIYDKAMKGKSLRAAINAKCIDCCCWQKSEVHKCTAYSCPLWLVRPYQRKKSAKHATTGQTRKETEMSDAQTQTNPKEKL